MTLVWGFVRVGYGDEKRFVWRWRLGLRQRPSNVTADATETHLVTATANRSLV